LRELAGTFVSRRSEAEQKSAGLDRLAPAELAKLDELVAAALPSTRSRKMRPRLKTMMSSARPGNPRSMVPCR